MAEKPINSILKANANFTLEFNRENAIPNPIFLIGKDQCMLPIMTFEFRGSKKCHLDEIPENEEIDYKKLNDINLDCLMI